MFLPPSCGGCGQTGIRWCDSCRESLTEIKERFCEVCGLPQTRSGVCNKCSENPPACSELRSWVAFDGAIRQALHRVKYRRDFGAAEQLAFEMLPFVRDLGWNIDMVIPVPLGRQRYRERGYNQVTSFGRPLALAMGWKFSTNALQRIKETRSQVDLSAVERVENVRDAFVADRKAVDGRSVLVLDDVSTTGATLNSCADALIRGGAKVVYAFTVARALPHHGLRTI